MRGDSNKKYNIILSSVFCQRSIESSRKKNERKTHTKKIAKSTGQHYNGAEAVPFVFPGFEWIYQLKVSVKAVLRNFSRSTSSLISWK